MAGEGVWPKADGDVWFGSDANRVYGLGLSSTTGTTAEGTFPKSDGDVLYASEVNTMKTDIAASHVEEIYTGSALNVTYGGTTTANMEFGSYTVPSWANYIICRAMMFCSVDPQQAGYSSRATLQIEGKETGQAYSTYFNSYMIAQKQENANEDLEATQVVEWYHELTAGEKSNGITFKLTTTITGYDSGTAFIQNRQIVYRWMS